MQSLWNALTTSGPDWAWFVASLFAVHVVTLWGGFAVYQALHRAGALQRWRVAAGKPPPEPLEQKIRVRVAVNTAAFLLAALGVYGALWLRGVDFNAQLPPWWTVAWQLVAFALVTDTAFYWMHRGLHRPWWFSRVHRQHHEVRYVRGLSAEYSHTLEDFGNLVVSFLGPVIFGAHPATVLIWFFVRMLETVDAHSGYVFTPWAQRHAYHHEFNRGNFGAFWSLWDRLLATDADWRAWKAKQP